jgi:hypothetical protein
LAGPMTPDGLERLRTSRREITELMSRFDVALKDARVKGKSADGRYVDAYTAGFLLAKVVIRASGYRVKGGENHRDTLLAVVWLMGSEAQATVDALAAARKRRNATMYDAAGMVDEDDVAALLGRVERFETLVREWLATEHPELIG